MLFKRKSQNHYMIQQSLFWVVNLKNKRPFEVRGFEVKKRKASWEALIWVEAQTVFQIGDKGKGYL